MVAGGIEGECFGVVVFLSSGRVWLVGVSRATQEPAAGRDGEGRVFVCITGQRVYGAGEVKAAAPYIQTVIMGGRGLEIGRAHV